MLGTIGVALLSWVLCLGTLMAMAPNPLPLMFVPVHWLAARTVGRGTRWIHIVFGTWAAFFGTASLVWFLDGTAARNGANSNQPLETGIGLVVAAVTLAAFALSTKPVTAASAPPPAARR